MNVQLNLVRSVVNCVEKTSHELKGGEMLTTTVTNYKISGDMEGTSSVVYSKGHLDNGVVYFSGYEIIEGRYKDSKGTFMLSHKGVFDQKGETVKISADVIDGSGSACFSRISGDGVVRSDIKNPDGNVMTLNVYVD